MDFRGSVSTDTRSIQPGDVFFALKGERFDGHDFIREALAKGASTIVYSDAVSTDLSREFPVSWIRVEDTLRAYGDWAAEYRRKHSAKVVAVTGSSGKTTLKEMLAHVLSAQFSVHFNKGTENNLVGVPKTIFGLKPSHEILILECGTNQPGEIGRLSQIASPDIAAITRVGPSHLQGLGSVEGVRKEKLSIVSGLRPGGALWVNGDDVVLSSCAQTTSSSPMYRVGLRNQKAELVAHRFKQNPEGIEFSVGDQIFRLRCLGEHNVLNALLTLALCRNFGVSDRFVSSTLESFCPVKGRLEIRRVDDFVFLDDTYNANPVSFEAALRVLQSLSPVSRRIVVAGDMLELGEGSRKLHEELGESFARYQVDAVLAVGNFAPDVAEAARKAGIQKDGVHVFQGAEEAGYFLRSIIRPKDAVLVKGSRGMKMEKVFECFTPSFIR